LIVKVLCDLLFGVAYPPANTGEAKATALALALDGRDGAVKGSRNILLV
jgi:hypothetical protein